MIPATFPAVRQPVSPQPLPQPSPAALAAERDGERVRAEIEAARPRLGGLPTAS